MASLALVCAWPADALARDPGAEHPILALRVLDARVATIGHRLAVSARDLCIDRQWLPGFSVHDLSQYEGESRDSAIRLFGLDSGPGVLAIAAGSAAERAGLSPDDILMEVDGVPLPGGGGRSGSFDHAEKVIETIEDGFSDGQADLEVLRSGERRRIRIEADHGCASRFQLIPSQELNARADGLYVQVSAAIANYVEDDAELAAVLAHEFAHNILRHKVRLDEARVSRGFLGNFGRNARLIRDTEAEADRLSIYLLDRGGYDPAAAVRFWRRFGPRGLNLFASPTHPGWRSRIGMFEEEIARIARQKSAGESPYPDFFSPFPTEREQPGE